MKTGEVKFEAKVEWRAGSPLLAANKNEIQIQYLAALRCGSLLKLKYVAQL